MPDPTNEDPEQSEPESANLNEDQNDRGSVIQHEGDCCDTTRKRLHGRS